MFKYQEVEIKHFPLMLLLATVLIADYYPVRFEEGYAFSAKETTLFVAPNDTSEAVTIIPPGEFLEIKSFTEVTFTADSCLWGWYGTTYRLENTKYEGFVQDRDLAFSNVLLGMDTLFVFRLTHFNVTENAFEGEISVIADGEVLYTQSYRPNWTPYGRMFDYDVTSTLADPDNLTAVRKLIVFYSGLDISGARCRSDILVWTDDCRLVAGPQAVSFLEDEASRQTTEIILPSTPGGHPDEITLHTVTELYNEETGVWEEAGDTSTRYRWSGHVFEE